nr:PAS-domain containing protein [Luteibacter sp. 9135]
MSRVRLVRLLPVCALALAIAGTAAMGGWWAWRRALAVTATQSADRLELHALAVQRLIDRFTVLPEVLALDPALRAALSDTGEPLPTLALNRKLAQANGAAHASTLTLLDRRGRAVAANNWDTPTSNVGLDYRFRPYFQEAMREGHATFYAMGVSTGVAGYFIARAVDDEQGRHVGVIVVKITLDEVRHDWARDDDTVLLADRYGVVFLTNRDASWLYRPLQALSPRDADAIRATRQYGDRALVPMRTVTLGEAGADARRVRVISPSLDGEVVWASLALPHQGWTLHLLADARPAMTAARDAALVVLAVWLPIVLFGLFLQQRLRLARLRQRSREELERMVAHHAAALRSAQDSVVAAAHEATQGADGNLEHLPQGVSVIDASLRLVAWNTRYREIFGFPEEYMRVGRPIEDLFRFNARRGLLGPGDPEEAIRRRLDYLRAGSPHMYERERPDGTTLEIRGNPLPDGGFVTSYADITAYKAAARELRSLATSLERRVDERTRDLHDAKAEAERANRSKTRFVAAAVHDLLQPLNAARLFVGALAAGHLDAAERELVERVRSALDTQDELLASLLDVSRLEGGAVEPRFAAVSLESLLADLAKQFGVLAASHGLQLRCVTGRAVVRSDALLLRRVLQNFLSNAIHYTPRGDVLIGARRQGDAVRIEVWDTGLGIPEAKTRAIFDEFLRLDNGVDRERRSSGLGLSIVDRIGRLLGAPVAVRSRPGKGSVFSITVPLWQGPSATTAKAAGAEDESPFAGARVMLLDADGVTRQATTRLLASWGCEVAAAASASEAMRHAETDAVPAILLLEDPIDGMTGEALRLALGARWGGMPPTLLIAEAPSTADVERAAAVGVRYLTRPLAPARLRAVMSRMLMVSG